MQDYGNLFTDIEYLNRKEVMQKINDPKVWSEVIKYRGLYAFTLPLIVQKKEAYVVLSPRILHKLMSLEQKFFKAYKLTVNYQKTSKNKLIMYQYYDNFKACLDALGFYISCEEVETLITYHYPVYKAKEQMVYYLETIFNHGFTGNFDLFAYQEIIEQIDKKQYRQTINDGVASELIAQSMELLNEWVNYKQTSSLLIAFSSYMYFNYIKPTENNNQLYSLLFLRHVLVKKGYDELISYLPIEKFIRSNSLKLEEVFQVSLATKDITYFILKMMSVFNVMIDEYIDYLEKNLASVEIEKDEAQQMIDNFPELKKYQAKFFLEHQEPKVYYTIDQFKKQCNTSYETARSSMDKLVELGFYCKEKVGKKFVYCLPNKQKIKQ